MSDRRTVGRRRFLSITAVACGLGLVRQSAAGDPVEFHTWRGTALGAQASIKLHHSDPDFAAALIERARDEIERLERVFSLYRAESALSRLNREGVLSAPPLDLVRLLVEAGRFSEITEGAFDATIQPLWRLYARHFSENGSGAEGPAPEAVAEVLAQVDYKAISADPARIAFRKPNMAVTLNGIAQGYITDRVADLFRREGLDRVLIDLGELRALGGHPTGRPWTIGLEDPRRRDRINGTLPLENAALATSAGSGTPFDVEGRYHHLLDPRSGQSSNRYLSLSVTAPTATEADALSTGLFHLDEGRIADVVGQHDRVIAIATLANGDLRTWSA